MMQVKYMSIVILAIVLVTSAHADEFQLTRTSIDGGGTTSAEGGGFELSGTIGQPDAGSSSGGRFELTGGFWLQTPPGDCNFDGLTDLLELIGFEACVTGPAGNSPSDCRCFDINNDNHVDLRDFAEFQTAFNGQE